MAGRAGLVPLTERQFVRATAQGVVESLVEGGGGSNNTQETRGARPHRGNGVMGIGGQQALVFSYSTSNGVLRVGTYARVFIVRVYRTHMVVGDRAYNIRW